MRKDQTIVISGLTTTGFHGRHVPQVSVKIDRVEAAERFLADIGVSDFYSGATGNPAGSVRDYCSGAYTLPTTTENRLQLVPNW